MARRSAPQLGVTRFGGIRPRAALHELSDGEAMIAHDVKLRNGKLQSWRERKAAGLACEDAKTIHFDGCCLLSWDTCVEVADYVTDYDRLYITGRSAQPEVFTLESCEPTYYFLGVPNPASAPTITVTDAGSNDTDAVMKRAMSHRSYVYTYVNIFGEESAPSPASASVDVFDGGTVAVSGFANPPDGYGIAEVWIYRSATAWREYSVKEQEPLTDYLKVAELVLDDLGTDLSSYTYTDSLLEKYLGPAIVTREVRVPPADMRNIAYLRGTGVLAGTTANRVHFCAPYTPYNWPAEYDLTLPYNIVHAVAVGSYYIVSTDSYPYVIAGDGACEARKCRAVDDVDAPLPDIACGYAHSAIATPFGMIYSSRDGLVLVNNKAQYSILTGKWFSTDDWVKIRPDTVRLGYARGYLFCMTDVLTFLLEIDGDTYNDMRLGELVTLSDSSIDMVTTHFGELMMLDEDRLVYQWNAGDRLRVFHWESGELDLDGTFSPTAAKVRTAGTHFKLCTPWKDVAYERYVKDEQPFRLGRLGRHLRYRVCFTGTEDVDWFLLGTSIRSSESGQ